MMSAAKTVVRILLRTTKYFATFLFFVIVAGGLAGWWWFNENVLVTLPSDLSAFKTYRPPTSCQVYAANGTPIDRFYLERRIWVPLESLPPHVAQAFIAAEDRRFMEHRGVDWLGVVRAFWTNLRAGRSRQGGSTITQQLVKNLIVGKERSYIRKMKEAALAVRLEKELTKQDLLELYLNYVALGSGNYGVEAAAQDYFGISARDLNPGQAAMLAGLVPAPSRYSPRTSTERAMRRRELVLDAMVNMRVLTRDEAKDYLDDPVLAPRDPSRDRRVGIAYATEVRRELRRLLSTELAVNEGLKVITPLDLELQAVAEKAVRDALAALEARQGRMGAVRRLPPEQWSGFITRAPGIRRDFDARLLRPEKDDCFEALVNEKKDLGVLRAGEWTFSLQPAERAVKVRPRAEGDKSGTLAATVMAGDVLRVCLESGDQVRLDSRPWSEGAAVVIENATGRVLALTGGYDVALEGFVRATQARRQPGSSFKPYVYGAALLQGKTQLDRVLDGPIALPAGGGKVWSPGNYDGKYAGPVTLRHAMTKSLNTVAVRLALQYGVDDIVRTARALGVKSPIRKDPTIALGSSEVTLMEHALAYSAIARGGVRLDPVLIENVLDVRETEVGKAGGELVVGGERHARLPGGASERVLPASIAYQLTDMLREVVRKGTARAAYKPGFERAGKTGTTNGFIDAWFMGFTPRHTIGVWIGTDGTSTLGDKETGGRAALPAWIAIAEALPQVEGERFPVPDDTVLVRDASGEWVGLSRGALPSSVLAVGHLDAAPLPKFDLAPAFFAPAPVVTATGALAAEATGEPAPTLPSPGETATPP